MNQLRVVVDCSSMLISTQLFRFGKAIEHFYYALLLSSDDYAAAGASAWESWAAQGFHIAIKAPPSAIRDADRLTIDMRPGRNFEITAATENRGALTRLSELLTDIERARTALAGRNDEARAQALLDNAAIETRLLRPVRECLKRNAVPGEAADALWAMVKRGLSALTNWQIQSVKVAVS
jgi:hypothetical protein